MTSFNWLVIGEVSTEAKPLFSVFFYTLITVAYNPRFIVGANQY